MEFVLLVVALALAGCLAGLRLGLMARRQSMRLAELNDSLESRIAERTRELCLALEASDEQSKAVAAASQAKSAILLEVRQTADGVALSVHDTGVGIPEDRMAELFQPFNRLGRETSDVAGTGIGLAVSRRLAEAMNGRLEAASVAGEGSTFTLHLPLARPAALPVTASPIPTGILPAATMLYVEDNPSNIALMRHVIAALGPIQLHVAENGHEGLALARDLRPDVILLDINLPGLSGFELKARLDADPLTRGLPVLALSASAMPQDVKRGKKAGFRDYLTKPLDIRALAEALNRALGSAEESRSKAAA
jgi:CheY-like chemotaxis protein